MQTLNTLLSLNAKIALAVGCLSIITGCSFSDNEIESLGQTTITDHRELKIVNPPLTTIVEGLDAPWAFTWLPNGNILVTEKFGQLRLAERQDNGEYQLLEQSISGIPEVFSDGHGGLLDIQIHPDFEQNNWIYLSYVTGNEEQNRLVISRAKLEGLKLQNYEVIFTVSDDKNGTQHYGSKFLWLDDGTLLISVGDGGNPPVEFDNALIREQAQNLATHFGKILRINDDGSVPSDNPFVGADNIQPEIFSYGHRNAQGLAFDRSNDRILSTEHGSRGGDELNVISSGKNYGWPLTTYSVEYDFTGTPISKHQRLPDMQEPLAVWTPSIAPSDIIYYSGEQYTQWKGSLFIVAMLLRSRDSLLAYPFSPAGGVIRFNQNESGQIVSQELLSIGDVRVRSLEQGPDGFLYVLTNQTSPQKQAGKNTGSIVRIN